MNICMIVHNNVTRDGRVMREANSLQRAGHSVTVLGLIDADAASPVEYLDSGVRIFRVFWLASAYRSLILSAVFRVLPVFIVLLGILVAAVYGLKLLFASGGPVSRLVRWLGGAFANVTHWTWLDAGYFALVAVLGIGLAYVVWRAVKSYMRLLGAGAQMKAEEEDSIRRYAEALLKEGALNDAEFPRLKSRIPDWVPDWLLTLTLEPLEWFGGNATRFTLLRYRAREMTEVAKRIKPDVIHCHDCLTLPTGWKIKKALGIPLIYDAHEIYEAAAARMPGITDYYARLHRKYLRRVDGFIAGKRQRRTLLPPRLSRSAEGGGDPQRHRADAVGALRWPPARCCRPAAIAEDTALSGRLFGGAWIAHPGPRSVDAAGRLDTGDDGLGADCGPAQADRGPDRATVWP